MGPLKQGFLGIYLTTFFRVRNFGNTSAMRVFFWKCSKFDLNFKSGEKNPKNLFCFLDNCIWIGCFKLSLLRREYLLSTVNVLTKSPKILQITKRDFLQLNAFTLINKCGKGTVVMISTVFRPVYNVPFRRVLLNVNFSALI